MHRKMYRQNEQRRVRNEFNRIGARYARWVTAWRGSFIKDLEGIPLFRDAKILDVACGPGTYSIPVSRHAGLVMGLDLAESMLRCARRRSQQRPAPNLAFVQGDAGCLPFASHTFDICLCAFSFAHFLNPKQVIKEMMRVLRTNGRIAIIDVIAPGNPRQQSLLNRLEKSRENCYTRIRNARELVKIFSSLPLECDYYGTERRLVSFRQWISASHLRPGSEDFRRAKRFFDEAAQNQADVPTSPTLAGRCQYGYTVVQFLLHKTS
ncbi:MAG: methyltransferase domain-containing protein [Acidobacteria bacterium]|nr:methyltransferase domain-containing protein [Acidobacteriota bacterium]